MLIHRSTFIKIILSIFCIFSDLMHLLQLLEVDHWLDLAYFMKGSTYHQLCLRPSQEVEADWSDMWDKLSRSVNYVEFM